MRSDAGPPEWFEKHLNELPLRPYDDFTEFREVGEGSRKTALPSKSWSGSCLLGGQRVRVLACFAKERQYVSLSVRRVDSIQNGHLYAGTSELSSGFTEPGNDTYVFQIAEHARLIRDRLPEGKFNGLIVLCAETGGGKSKIARHLIHLYLSSLVKKPLGRRPHLLTFEDPLEKDFHSPLNDEQRAIDYTPRVIEVDVPSVKEGLADALRQKPSLVLVGETRDPADWEHLVNFAGGHLLITTAHAGSVQEMMAKIVSATRTRTPAERGVLASRLRAIVHLRSGSVNDVASYTLSSIWRHTEAGHMALVSDGLGSVLPRQPSDTEDRGCSSFGYLWAAEELMRLRPQEKQVTVDDAAKIRKAARHWDLHG